MLPRHGECFERSHEQGEAHATRHQATRCPARRHGGRHDRPGPNRQPGAADRSCGRSPAWRLPRQSRSFFSRRSSFESPTRRRRSRARPSKSVCLMRGDLAGNPDANCASPYRRPPRRQHQRQSPGRRHHPSPPRRLAVGTHAPQPTASLTVAPTPRAVAMPAPTPIVVAVAAPEDAVSSFYQNAVAGNFDAAYSSWSSRTQWSAIGGSSWWRAAGCSTSRTTRGRARRRTAAPDIGLVGYANEPDR